MLAIVKSVGVVGLDGYIVDVEVDISNGLPGLDIVGLPDAAVRESRERVRAAVRNSGLQFPMGRITVNLAPADFRKEGPVYDLPIAVGLLAASGQLPQNSFRNHVFMGELSLDGAIRGVTGVLPGVLVCRAKAGGKGVVVPVDNADEAALAEGVAVFPVDSLRQLAGLLRAKEAVSPYHIDIRRIMLKRQITGCEDMADVRGQSKARRALEIAAAGGHNVLLIGPPGSGKTMMARRLSGIMPEMSFKEALEVTKIYSVSGLLNSGMPLVTERPFRAPHHSISKRAMVGGGRIPKPGEISLAHYGILFLDEFPEFSRESLESLRQPLEDGSVCISRVSGSISYPAGMMLVAAMNPCPCGYLGDFERECTCTASQVYRYRNRISGPLMDRIDIHVDIPRVKFNDLQGNIHGESSAEVRKRVKKARSFQAERFAGTDITCNAGMRTREVRHHCGLQGRAASLMRNAFEKLGLSARGYSRVLKVARTIADLDGQAVILADHLAEAIQHRSVDRAYSY